MKTVFQLLHQGIFSFGFLNWPSKSRSGILSDSNREELKEGKVRKSIIRQIWLPGLAAKAAKVTKVQATSLKKCGLTALEVLTET